MGNNEERLSEDALEEISGMLSKEEFEVFMDEVEELVADGERSKQAVNQISSRYGFSKNVLYNAYLKRKDERGE